MTPLDPQLAAIVAAIRARAEMPPFSGPPAQARERMRRAIMAARERTGVPDVGSVQDATAVDGSLEVPVRIYRPGGPSRPLPTVVFFHGGGFVLGSVDLMDDIARKLCRDVDAVVVSVDYRLAPEHPFPAAHEDAVAATRWALRQAHALGGDDRRVAVCGESAGANLATSAALALGDHQPPLAAQLLIVPGVDLARDVDAIAASGRDFPMLSPQDLVAISRLYMGGQPKLAEQAPPSPLRAPSLAGSPAAIIALAGHDPLREEGLVFAARLQSEGVRVSLLEFGDMFHPFFGFFAASDAARRANDLICQAFAAQLHGPQVTTTHWTQETT